MNTKQQGLLGERAAAAWLLANGYSVAVPFGDNPDYDLLADAGDARILRVQVKTTVCRYRDNWSAMICTRGGNRSWNGTVKLFSPARCDYLFVLVGDGRQWFIPAPVVEGGQGIVLGGPKYAEYEVERGRPILEIAA